jgi:hypothetical protein
MKPVPRLEARVIIEADAEALAQVLHAARMRATHQVRGDLHGAIESIEASLPVWIKNRIQHLDVHA